LIRKTARKPTRKKRRNPPDIKASLQRERERYLELADSTGARVDDLEGEIESAQSDIQEALEAIKDLADERRTLEKQIKDLNRQSAALSSEKMKAEGKIAKLRSAIKPLQQKYNEYSRVADELYEQIQVL
jgi:chromosome segregation ATPase